MSEELEEQADGLYETHNIILKKSQTNLFEYCDEYSREAKLFRNTMIYRCRQLYFAYKKGYQNLTEQEQAVMNEFAIIGITFPLKNKGQYLPGYI